MSLESGYRTDLSVPTCRMQENNPARSLWHQEKCKYCTSGTTGRGIDRERCKEGASIIGGTCRRSATSAQPGNPREPGLLEVAGESRSGERKHCVFYLMFEGTLVIGLILRSLWIYLFAVHGLSERTTVQTSSIL